MVCVSWTRALFILRMQSISRRFQQICSSVLPIFCRSRVLSSKQGQRERGWEWLVSNGVRFDSKYPSKESLTLHRAESCVCSLSRKSGSNEISTKHNVNLGRKWKFSKGESQFLWKNWCSRLSLLIQWYVELDYAIIGFILRLSSWTLSNGSRDISNIILNCGSWWASIDRNKDLWLQILVTSKFLAKRIIIILSYDYVRLQTLAT